MKDLRRKLNNSKGETVTEMLISILICTISVALLFSGVMAANHINRQAEISDNGFFDALNAAEQKDAASPYQADKTIMVNENGGIGASFKVNYYGNATIYSYKYKPVPQEPAGGGSTP